MTGCATNDGTRRFSLRMQKKGLPSTGFRLLGRTGWAVSTLGFGCYRIDDEMGAHISALDHAFRAGCNIIDTSTNYTEGGSERCVGLVIKSLVSTATVVRDEMVLVSKVGYVQGKNLKIVQDREANKDPYPDVVKYMEGCWHCIHPTFIHDQLQLSLSRLDVSTVDVYLLHNPEYFFTEALHRPNKVHLTELRSEFYSRIRKAFKQLEQEVKEGKIQCYGVSSNTFGKPEDDPEMTSVSEMLRVAREVALELYKDADKHHFSVVQLPFNLFESGPALLKNNVNKSALAFCDEHDIAVLVNRPLNAFVNDQMLRLTDFKTSAAKFSLEELLKMVEVMEKEFLELYVPQISVDPETLQPEAFFRWAEELKRANLSGLAMEQWNHIQNDIILPQVNYLIQQLEQHFSALENTSFINWRTGYISALDQLLMAITHECAKKSQEMSDKVSAKLNPLLPEKWRTESLSKKALAVLVNTKGVSCVLNGMRRKEYVDDSLGLLSLKPFDTDLKLFSSFELGA